MACDCIDRVDQELREQNTMLGLALSLDGSPARAVVVTAFVEKRRGQRAGFLVASYCPFWGVAYDDAPGQPGEGTR